MCLVLLVYALKAKKISVPVEEIMEFARWTNKHAFAKFYVQEKISDDRFSTSILQIRSDSHLRLKLILRK